MLLDELKKDLDEGKVSLEDYQQAIYDRCEFDIEAFALFFFPHYCELEFNEFHRDCFRFYERRETAVRRLDCAPRGYAKSTIKTLIKPIHDVCYGLEKYILFFSATKSQATQKLTDIRSEILDNDLLHDIYGVHFPTRRPGTEAFIINTEHGDVYLQAVGAGTEVRGIRFGEHRPTKIVLDDVEDSEEVHNEEIREKTYDWLQEVVSNLGSNRTHIEIVGTVLHRDSLLMKLTKNPAYASNIYKAIITWADNQDLWHQWTKIYSSIENENRAVEARRFYEQNQAEMLKGTKVLWPEKESYYDLMCQMVEKGKRAFMKEKQNAPLPSDEAIFDNLHWYHEDENRGGLIIESSGVFVPYEELYAYGGIDPSTGKTKSKGRAKLDFTSILGGYKDLKGRFFAHKDVTKKIKPTIQIHSIFDMNEMMNFEKFVVEENLFRGLLTENIKREKKFLEEDRRKRGIEDWEIKVPFYEIENREKKEARIFTLEPKVNNGWILFNRALSMEFINQVEEFPNSNHDDAPDVLEMVWGLVNNRYKPSPIPMHIMGSR